MSNIELKSKVSRGFGKFKLTMQKHAPEILVVSGVVGVVASAVVACKATTKASKIIDETKKDVATINYCAEHPEELSEPYTKEDRKKDLTIVYTRTGLKLAKTYGPALIMGGLSIAGILAGSNILRKRNVALGAAYAAVDRGFRDYRANVIERFGEEMDKELKYNIKTQEVEETVEDEKGNKKTVKKTVRTANTNELSGYTFCFDVGCPDWKKDAEHNKWFLIQQQNWANEKLKNQGHLFLNDVLEMVGIPKCKAGQIVGWLYKPEDPTRDGFVDFGLLDIKDETKRRFINGDERSVWLTFNVDGPIFDLI